MFDKISVKRLCVDLNIGLNGGWADKQFDVWDAVCFHETMTYHVAYTPYKTEALKRVSWKIRI